LHFTAKAKAAAAAAAEAQKLKKQCGLGCTFDVNQH
jgi:hypothetical protein